MTLISVVIPSYNYAHFLAGAVESALNQDGVEREIVIVENASTDGSRELARQLATDHHDVRVVEFDDNHGVVASMNRCVDAARGEYISILCADDLLADDSLRRAVRFLDAHPAVGLVYGHAPDFSDEQEARALAATQPLSGEPLVYGGDEWIGRTSRTGRNPIRHPEVVSRVAIQREVGGFDPASPHACDFNMWLRIAARSDIGFLPGPPQGFYRRHTSSLSTADYSSSLAELEEKFVAFERFFDWLDGHPHRDEWREMMRHALLVETLTAANHRFQSRVNPTDRDADVDALVGLAQRIANRPLRRSETIELGVRRRLGPRPSRYFPPFAAMNAWRRHRGHRYEVDRTQRGL